MSGSLDELEESRETLEIMADPDSAQAVRPGLLDVEAGPARPLEDVLKARGL